jgi:hypothetical protein
VLPVSNILTWMKWTSSSGRNAPDGSLRQRKFQPFHDATPKTVRVFVQARQHAPLSRAPKDAQQASPHPPLTPAEPTTMGQFIAKLMETFQGFKRQQRVLMLGLDAAGKVGARENCRVFAWECSSLLFGARVTDHAAVQVAPERARHHHPHHRLQLRNREVPAAGAQLLVSSAFTFTRQAGRPAGSSGERERAPIASPPSHGRG